MISVATGNGAKLHNDQLPTLGAATDPAEIKEILRPIVDRSYGSGLRIEEVAISTLRQRGHRCVLRYRVRAMDSTKNKEREFGIIGKVYRPGYGEKVFQYMKDLWRAGFASDGRSRISIPEPLDYSSSLCILFQREVPGRAIKMLLKEQPQSGHFRLLAQILAKLHSCSVVPGRPYQIRDHLMRCHPKHGFLSLACPEMADSIDYIVDKAHEIEARLKLQGVQFTPLHGDFHLGQIHVEQGFAWLIDFDALSYGDPAADLGNILVFLKQKAKRNDTIGRFIDCFLDEYFRHMPSDIAKRIPLYEALTHLRRSCKTLRLQEEGWRNRIERMVAMGIACIDEVSSNLELRSADPVM